MYRSFFMLNFGALNHFYLPMLVHKCDCPIDQKVGQLFPSMCLFDAMKLYTHNIGYSVIVRTTLLNT